jgi:hypothetical protein
MERIPGLDKKCAAVRDWIGSLGVQWRFWGKCLLQRLSCSKHLKCRETCIAIHEDWSEYGRIWDGKPEV